MGYDKITGSKMTEKIDPKERSVKLTTVQIGHVLRIICDARDKGWHYGVKQLYYKKTEEIIEILEDAVG